jgi:hypothetical protein
MNYNVIITEGGLPDDPTSVHPVKANKLDDFKVAVGSQSHDGEDTVLTDISGSRLRF